MPPMESPEETVAREAAEAAAVAAQNGEAPGEVEQPEPAAPDAEHKHAADVAEEPVAGDAQPDVLTEQLDARLDAHLKGVRDDVSAFLKDEIEPMKKNIEMLAGLLSALTEASPESISGLVAEMEGLRQQVSDMASKLKHWL